MLEDQFGDIIQKARLGQGLALDEVAAAAGLSAEQLEALERGVMSPNAHMCQAIARCLHLEPSALLAIAIDAYQPVPPACSLQVLVGQDAANSYVVKLHDKALIVDPGGDPQALLALAEQAGWQVGAILVTHGHRDHTGGLAWLARHLAVPVVAHPAECPSVAACGELDGVRVLHCPGHTKFSLAFSVDGALFTGDTMFAGSLGRAVSYQDLLASARRLLAFPPETAIFPGHGPATTVAQERIHNPFVGVGLQS